MTISTVAVVWHPEKERARALRDDILEHLGERGVTEDEERPDLVISLGGDGTMLRAAQIAHGADALLLGVNLGRMGYLSEVDAGDEMEALEKLLAGSYSLDERIMLRCEADGHAFVGLNEVLVERASRHRLVDLRVRVGGEHLATLHADGLIVATPTGSTAYALSAGGPIVAPAAHCLVLAPVNAHMIFSRPFVLTDDATVEVTVVGEGAALSLDGAIGRDLDGGAVVVVSRDPRPLRLVRLAGPGFIERLRRKLDLPR